MLHLQVVHIYTLDTHEGGAADYYFFTLSCSRVFHNVFQCRSCVIMTDFNCLFCVYLLLLFFWKKKKTLRLLQPSYIHYLILHSHSERTAD